MLGPLPRATRRWNHQQRLAQRDQLGDLRLTAHLRPGPLRIRSVKLQPPGHRQVRNVADIVHAQFVFRGQGVITRNDRDLPLGSSPPCPTTARGAGSSTTPDRWPGETLGTEMTTAHGVEGNALIPPNPLALVCDLPG